MKKFLPTSTGSTMLTTSSLSVNKSRGFTLVELLVVISIIAVLSVIGITVFGNVQKNARDSRRQADIDSISKALEVKFDSVTGKYKALTGDMFSSGVIPKDPSNPTKDYIGSPTAEGPTYEVCADLESKCTTGTSPVCHDFTQKDYCRKNQQ